MESRSFGFTSTFLGSTTAIAAASLMAYMRNNYDHLTQNNMLTCVAQNPAKPNCALGGSYGSAILALNIISIIFNVLLVVLIVWKWHKNNQRGKMDKALRVVFSIICATSLFAVGTDSYNLYIHNNFGSEKAHGNFGGTCPAVGECTTLTGGTGNLFYGLNISSAVVSATSMLMYFNFLLEKYHQYYTPL
jgi:uncharacterized membrane protein